MADSRHFAEVSRQHLDGLASASDGYLEAQTPGDRPSHTPRYPGLSTWVPPIAQLQLTGGMACQAAQLARRTGLSKRPRCQAVQAARWFKLSGCRAVKHRCRCEGIDLGQSPSRFPARFSGQRGLLASRDRLATGSRAWRRWRRAARPIGWRAADGTRQAG